VALQPREPSENRGPRIPWDEIERRLTGREGPPIKLPIGLRGIVGILLAVAIVIWFGTGIYRVGPGEVAVVRQFGKEIGQTGPGLHYHLPGPIQRVTPVNLAEVREMAVGFEEVSGVWQDRPEEALMLTSDENMVDIHVIVLYRVSDASQYLFKVKDIEGAEGVLKTATETALRTVVGRNTIDDVMINKRTEVQDEAREILQTLMDEYETGILITAVRLQEVDAPEEVRDAFHEVVRAREDKETLIREAEGYAADIVPRARGEKEQKILEAEAYKQERIIRAEGDAARFLAVLAEYNKAPTVTKQRLYLEAMETILAGIEKVIVDPDVDGKIYLWLGPGGWTTLAPEVTG